MVDPLGLHDPMGWRLGQQGGTLGLKGRARLLIASEARYVRSSFRSAMWPQLVAYRNRRTLPPSQLTCIVLGCLPLSSATKIEARKPSSFTVLELDRTMIAPIRAFWQTALFLLTSPVSERLSEAGASGHHVTSQILHYEKSSSALLPAI